MTHSVPELGEKFSHLWLDGLRRNQLEDGTLDKLVARSGIGGVSTAIGSRDRAIDDNEFYRAVISVCARYGETAEQIYERLNVEDAQAVADVLRPTYDATGCRDGYASLALSPFLAYTTADTIKDADRLWAAVDRPNLMISVPATDAGVAAIPALIARGINVRVTLLFSRSRYEQIADAYCDGLETRVARGATLANVTSVASVNVHAIDAWADRALERVAACMGLPMRGKAGLAVAARCYGAYRSRQRATRWDGLRVAGAQPQRLCWVTSGTEEPASREGLDLLALTSTDTLTSVTPATLDRLLDDRVSVPNAPEEIDAVSDAFEALRAIDIHLEQQASALEREGLAQLVDAYTRCVERIETRRRAIVGAQQGVGT